MMAEAAQPQKKYGKAISVLWNADLNNLGYMEKG